VKNIIALAGTAVLPLDLVGCTSTATTPGDFPSGDLTIIVPFAPGGPTDTMARTVAAQMEKDLGATTLVVNKEGATGAVAMQSMLASMSPDTISERIKLPQARQYL
jgi:tripartite-type tricarboxylate transporter receptor subunit TctC